MFPPIQSTLLYLSFSGNYVITPLFKERGALEVSADLLTVVVYTIWSYMCMFPEVCQDH